jgi:hypothetical protein
MGTSSGLSFATDRVAMNIHGNVDSHIDALCHVMFDGTLYNDISADAVNSAGATELSIEVAGNGIVGRTSWTGCSSMTSSQYARS